MVSLLDAGMGEFLIPIFLFILIYAILYGVMIKVSIFGDNKSLNAFIAFGLTLLFVVMPGAMEFISIIAPWFIVLVVLAFSFLLVFMFMGISTNKITEIAKDPTVYWTVIILGIIIVVAGLTSVYGPVFGAPPAGSESVGREIQGSVFNAKVLTAVFILLIFAFAVRLLSFESKMN